MRRREFIKQAAITAAAVASTSQLTAAAKTPSNPIPRRALGKTGEKLSMIGFGGIVVMNETTRRIFEYRGGGCRSRHQLF